jgi:hypothetical protein
LILRAFRCNFTNMKVAHKIVIYSFCLLLSLTWGVNCVSDIIKTTTEKNNQDRKETLPNGESDTEDKTFELVYVFSPPFSIPFQDKITTELNFSKVIVLHQSVFLGLSNPPPECKFIA